MTRPTASRRSTRRPRRPRASPSTPSGATRPGSRQRLPIPTDTSGPARRSGRSRTRRSRSTARSTPPSTGMP
jgi:hypothetical protein